MLDFTALMARAQREGWAIVALDCAVDTTTPAGEAMANVLATFAQFERRLIAQRTREALARKREAGVKLGRPRELSTSVVRRIRRERQAGRSYRAIAEALNRDRIPTAHGGKQWWPATVRAVAGRLGQQMGLTSSADRRSQRLRRGEGCEGRPDASRSLPPWRAPGFVGSSSATGCGR
jgi:resolvase-like protein/recombinase